MVGGVRIRTPCPFRIPFSDRWLRFAGSGVSIIDTPGTPEASRYGHFLRRHAPPAGGEDPATPRKFSVFLPKRGSDTSEAKTGTRVALPVRRREARSVFPEPKRAT